MLEFREQTDTLVDLTASYESTGINGPIRSVAGVFVAVSICVTNISRSDEPSNNISSSTRGERRHKNFVVAASSPGVSSSLFGEFII